MNEFKTLAVFLCVVVVAGCVDVVRMCCTERIYDVALARPLRKRARNAGGEFREREMTRLRWNDLSMDGARHLLMSTSAP